MRRLLLMGMLLGLLAGCAGRPTPVETPPVSGALPTAADPASSELIVTPDPAAQGRISLVNPNARYVVVSFPIGTMPPLDTVLDVYRDGLKVGEIQVTGPKRDFNIAADIRTGECRVGDEVRSR